MDELRRLKFTIFARNAFLLTIAITAGYWLGGDRYHFSFAPADYVATGVFIALLSWLLLPNFRLDDGHLENAPDSFALRLGKLTKRTTRRLKRLLGTSNSN